MTYKKDFLGLVNVVKLPKTKEKAMTNTERLVNLEKECAFILNALQTSLCDYIERSKMEELSENNTVTKETWEKYGKMKNPTEFFLPERQANIVKNFMRNCNSSFDFKNKLRMMYRQQEIYDSEAIYLLNPATIKAIENFAKNENIDLESAWYDIKK